LLKFFRFLEHSILVFGGYSFPWQNRPVENLPDKLCCVTPDALDVLNRPGIPGDSYDHALAETINGLYKTEVIHKRGPWRTVDDVEYATLEWVDWFNNRRLLEPIGSIPPAELEMAYYRQLEGSPMAA